jgi:glutaredoxin-related protein
VRVDWGRAAPEREERRWRTVLQIWVGDTHVGGCDDLRAGPAGG